MGENKDPAVAEQPKDTMGKIMGYVKGAGTFDGIVMALMAAMYFIGGEVLENIGSTEIATSKVMNVVIMILIAAVFWRFLLFAMDRMVGFSFKTWFASLTPQEKVPYICCRMIAIAIVIHGVMGG